MPALLSKAPPEPQKYVESWPCWLSSRVLGYDFTYFWCLANVSLPTKNPHPEKKGCFAILVLEGQGVAIVNKGAAGRTG